MGAILVASSGLLRASRTLADAFRFRSIRIASQKRAGYDPTASRKLAIVRVLAYGYDGASQLTSVNGSSYSFDANGNRTMTGYSTGTGNQLLSDGTWNYSYDAVGNTIKKTNIGSGEYWTYSWNDANQLTVAADYQSNGTLIQSATFKYDVFGNRVEEDDYNASTQVTTVTKFAYNAAGNIWADLNASNQLLDRRLFVNVNGQTQPFARIDASNNVSWYLTDRLGSVCLITDNSAAVIDQIDYDAWGNITNETNAANGDRYKYASGQYDAVLGMTLYAHNSTGRRYMASNGNWLNADPTGLAAGPNPYDYVGNNPTNAIDPSGLIATYMEGGEKKTATEALVKDLKLTGMPSDDYLKKLKLDGITSSKKFEDLVKDIMTRTVKTPTTYNYESLTQFVNHAKYRAWVVVFAEQLQKSRPSFSRGDNIAAFKDSQYWEPNNNISYTVEEKESKVKRLILKKGKTPADGIREFFGENGKNAEFDCATFQSLVSRRALLEVLGERLYNQKYKDIAIAGLRVTNDPFLFAKAGDALLPGCALRFQFPEGVDAGNYNTENTIYIGDGRLVGHPFRKPLDGKGMVEAIESEAKVRGTRANLITDIQFRALPK